MAAHNRKCCKPIYNAGLNDCRDYANAVADTAERHQNKCEICKPKVQETPQ